MANKNVLGVKKRNAHLNNMLPSMQCPYRNAIFRLAYNYYVAFAMKIYNSI